MFLQDPRQVSEERVIVLLGDRWDGVVCGLCFVYFQGFLGTCGWFFGCCFHALSVFLSNGSGKGDIHLISAVKAKGNR